MKRFILLFSFFFVCFHGFNQTTTTNLVISLFDCSIYNKPKFVNPLTKVCKYDTLRVVDSASKFYKVNYSNYLDNFSGYILKKNVTPWSEFLKNTELPKNKRQLDRLTRLQKKFGKINGLKIFNGLVWIGMTESEAYHSLGEPTRKIIKIGSWGSQKRLIYGVGGDLSQILTLYFEDGYLVYYITNPH